jgi:hypothetical protein
MMDKLEAEPNSDRKRKSESKIKKAISIGYGFFRFFGIF